MAATPALPGGTPPGGVMTKVNPHDALAEIRRVVKSDDSSEMCRCELLSDEVLLALVEVAEKAWERDGTKPSEDKMSAALIKLEAAFAEAGGGR